MNQAIYLRYDFGYFRVDAGKRLLLRDGEVVPLTPKCFDLLLALLETGGEGISKDCLMKRVWPDTFVEEGNLTYNISMLRKALGEKASTNQYIVTIPGHGYRFVAEVKKIGDELVDSTLEQTVSPPPPRVPSRSKKRRVIIALLLIIFCGVLIYWLVAQRLPATASRPTTPVKSIAVLPFHLLGTGPDDPELEFLSDGISESLNNSLSQLPGMEKVIARSSCYKYRGKDVDAQEVAGVLGVEAIVTGSILKLGEQLQFSVELVDTRAGTHVWGEKYNRKTTDLLQVQSDICLAIVDQLRFHLTAVKRRQLENRGTANPQAYEQLERGKFYGRKGGAENHKKALENFNQALTIDPDYALAYACLALAGGGPSTVDPKENRVKAKAAALKALELDENLAEAHLALANLYRDEWAWGAAEAEYKRAIELNPNLSRAHVEYADYLGYTGRIDQALIEIRRSRELDPLSLHTNLSVGAILLWGRRYDEALIQLKKTFELDKDFIPAITFLGFTYAAMGMYREAIAAHQESIHLGDTSTGKQIFLGAAYAGAGERGKALAILKRLETNKDYVAPGEIAVLYTLLGEREQAFASLERAYAAHDMQMQFLLVELAFDPLRSDPRFADLLRRVGLQ